MNRKKIPHIWCESHNSTCTPGLSGKVTYTKCVYRRESNWVVPTHVRYTRSQLYSSGMVSRVVLLDTHTTDDHMWVVGWLLCEKNFLFQIFSQWVSGKCVCVRLRRCRKFIEIIKVINHLRLIRNQNVTSLFTYLHRCDIWTETTTMTGNFNKFYCFSCAKNVSYQKIEWVW